MWKKGPLINRIRLGFSDFQIEKMERAAFLFGLEDGMFMELNSFIRRCVFMKTEAILHKANRRKRVEREKEEAEKTESSVGHSTPL